MDDSICRTDIRSDQDIPDFEIYLGSNHHFDQNEFRKISSVVRFVLLFCLDFVADSDAVDDESLEWRLELSLISTLKIRLLKIVTNTFDNNNVVINIVVHDFTWFDGRIIINRTRYRRFIWTWKRMIYDLWFIIYGIIFETEPIWVVFPGIVKGWVWAITIFCFLWRLVR